MELRRYFERALVWPVPCGVCGRPVHVDSVGRGGRSGWQLGHIKPRWSHPELTFVLSNLRVEHVSCGSSSAKRHADASIRARALAEYGIVEEVPAELAGGAASASARPAWLSRPYRSTPRRQAAVPEPEPATGPPLDAAGYWDAADVDADHESEPEPTPDPETVHELPQIW
jgi:hypothetical protein